MDSIMANLILGQDVANKRKRQQTAANLVSKCYSLQQAARMRRYGSLININPSGESDRGSLKQQPWVTKADRQTNALMLKISLKHKMFINALFKIIKELLY